jgi:hypothetical protein
MLTMFGTTAKSMTSSKLGSHSFRLMGDNWNAKKDWTFAGSAMPEMRRPTAKVKPDRA